jgi:hypothetical protein
MAGDEVDGRSDDEEAGEMFGGWVDRTTMAPIEGEYVVPAPGSQAINGPDAGWTGQQVTWSFPVEVEVVSELSEEHLQAVAKHVFDELNSALRGVG